MTTLRASHCCGERDWCWYSCHVNPAVLVNERSPFSLKRLPGHGAVHSPGLPVHITAVLSCQSSFIQEKVTFEVNKTQICKRNRFTIIQRTKNIGAHENICMFSCQQLDTFIFKDEIVTGSKRLGSAGSLYYSSAALQGYLYQLLQSVRPHAPVAASVYNSRHFTCTPAVWRVREQQKCFQIKSCITLNKKEYFKRFVTVCKLFTRDVVIFSITWSQVWGNSAPHRPQPRE